MAHFSHGRACPFLFIIFLFTFFIAISMAQEDIFLEWHVAINTTIKPVSIDQPVITINDMFPGPLINSTTWDTIHVNVFNHMDEPVLMTWNGIQQRLNSWQDGVSGTNCPIQPGQNWTYAFQMKDQIGSFFYFPSLNFHMAGGGYGAIRVNNRAVIPLPFDPPEDDFDLLIGDWYGESFKEVRSQVNSSTYKNHPRWILMNGKGPFQNPPTRAYESFSVSKGKTYRFRISNVGTRWSFNFRIQNHNMVLVETEGSYTNKITLDSLDVHLGQSFSVLVTADEDFTNSYYIVATPKILANQTHADTSLVAIGVLQYDNSTILPTGPLPNSPNSSDIDFSVNQAKSIRWNLTAGASRPNPQGTFNVSNVTISQTFILDGSKIEIDGVRRYTVNNVSYIATTTPLKLMDNFLNGSGIPLDVFSVIHDVPLAVNGAFVVSGNHKGWLEIIFLNKDSNINSWHLDGFGFFVVGFGDGEWTPKSRSSYNLYDPIVRSTVQVYPGRWTSIYAYLDNPGMWNLRSQGLINSYLGQELYIRVYDSDPNPAKEKPPPQNLLYCGIVQAPPPPPPPSPSPIPDPPAPPPPQKANAPTSQIGWFLIIFMAILVIR